MGKYGFFGGILILVIYFLQCSNSLSFGIDGLYARNEMESKQERNGKYFRQDDFVGLQDSLPQKFEIDGIQGSEYNGGQPWDVKGNSQKENSIEDRSDIQIDGNVGKEALDVFVSTLGSDTSGDGSKEYPYQTIQMALDRSVSNGNVNVNPGEYIISKPLHLYRISNITIQAMKFQNVPGFDDGETQVYVLPASFIRMTVIRIDQSPNTIIRGLVFRGGSNGHFSGGMYVSNSATVSIEDSVLAENMGLKGGGFMAVNSSISFIRCLFYNNEALLENKQIEHVLTHEATASRNQFYIKETLFLSNFPSYKLKDYNTGYGGAGYLRDSDAVFDHCEFRNNSGLIGGVIAIEGDSDATFIKSKAIRNSATLQGSVLFSFDSIGRYNITNCEFVNNYCENVKCQVIYSDKWHSGWTFHHFWELSDPILQWICICSCLCVIVNGFIQLPLIYFRRRFSKECYDASAEELNQINADSVVKDTSTVNRFSKLIFEWHFSFFGLRFSKEIPIYLRILQHILVYTFQVSALLNKLTFASVFPEFSYDNYDVVRTMSWSLEKILIYVIPIVSYTTMQIFCRQCSEVLVPSVKNVFVSFLSLGLGSSLGLLLTFTSFDLNFFLSIYWVVNIQLIFMMLFISLLISDRMRVTMSEFFLKMRDDCRLLSFGHEIAVFEFVKMKRKLKRLNEKSWIVVIPHSLLVFFLIINALAYTLFGARVSSEGNEPMLDRLSYVVSNLIVTILQLGLMAWVSLRGAVWERRVERFMLEGRTVADMLPDEEIEGDGEKEDIQHLLRKQMSMSRIEYERIPEPKEQVVNKDMHHEIKKLVREIIKFATYVRRKQFVYRLPFTIDLYVGTLVAWLSILISILAVSNVLRKSFEEDIFLASLTS